MNVSLITLNTKNRVDFDENPDVSTLKDDRILSLEDIHVKGHIIDNGTDEYEVSMKITGLMNLKSSINSSPVPYKLDIDYDEFISDFVELYKNSSNTLDILPIIWENILLEIPIRAVNTSDEYEMKEGEGWEVLDN